MLYFVTEDLHDAEGEYVLWCDGMGTGRALSTSLRNASNFIFKLHSAFDKAIDGVDTSNVYPVMDGMYVTSSSYDDITSIMEVAFAELAQEFLEWNDLNKHFLVRAGIAFGGTIHGDNIKSEAFVPEKGEFDVHIDQSNFEDSTLDNTRSRLLLSPAMVSATRAEDKAPPFGVFVHDSALSFPEVVKSSNDCFPSKMWHWWRNNDSNRKLASDLSQGVLDYLEKAKKRSHELDYPRESISRHKSLTEEYFREFMQ
jgi:hypothetical protein